MKRKLIAILLGLLTTLLIGFTSILWGQLFSTLANTLSSDYTRKLFGVQHFDSSEINDYYLFYLIGLAITLGLMVTFIVWDFNDKFRRRLLIYIPFLILILGFSIYNYAHFDYIMQPDIQAFFNLLIIFLGLVCTIQLWKLKTKSSDGIILKYLIELGFL